jgi:hypothetical protein
MEAQTADKGRSSNRKTPACYEMLHRPSELDRFFGTIKAKENETLKEVASDLTKCNLDTVAIQELRSDEDGTQPADDYTFISAMEIFIT